MCSTGREKLSSGFQILSLFFSFSAYNFPPSSVFIAAGKNTCNYCNNTVKLCAFGRKSQPHRIL